MSMPKPLGILLALSWVAGVLAARWNFSLLMEAHSQLPLQPQSQTILTILLRDSLGHPLEGVSTEVLSYDWGMPMGQPFGIIAKGETDKNGVVAFDSTRWPFSGYRVRFTPTSHTKPNNAYFLPDDQNQYRGYPGISTGGVTETQKFVLSGSDGLIYNDLSADGQLPEYQRDPVGGMLNPRVSVMPGQDFVATALAATATAGSRGEPTPTFPPPPATSPRPGEVQSPLTVTPGAEVVATTAAPATSALATVTTAQTNSVTSGVVTSPPPVATTIKVATTAPGAKTAQNSRPTPQSGKGNESNLFVSILLAVAGIVALAAFWEFRFKMYPLLGIEKVSKNRKNYFLSRSDTPDKGNTKATESDKK